MQKVISFLQEKLNLQISEEKSGIRYAKKGIQFLSYDIHTWRADKVLKTKIRGSHTKFRTVNEHIRLRVPIEKVMQFCQRHGYGDWSQTRPKSRPALIRATDVEIVSAYNTEFRGFVNYYCMADDAKKKLHKLQYLAHYSLVHTIADKHRTKKTTILEMLKKGNDLIYRYKEREKDKELKVFSLKDMIETPKVWLNDEIPSHLWFTFPTSELLKRLNAKECEYCGRSDLPSEVHHVRKLKDLQSKPSLQKWQKVMIARNRKTMVLCVECHRLLHAGNLPDLRYSSDRI
jgi:predicted DNA-binding protein YlxM (UPF0122 family)